MHELSLCQSLVGIVEEEARRQGFRKVRRIRVTHDPFAAIEPEALAFAFDAAAAGTVCAGAVLEILAVPADGQCLDCGASVAVADFIVTCPQCGGSRVRADGAGALRIKDIDVE